MHIFFVYRYSKLTDLMILFFIFHHYFLLYWLLKYCILTVLEQDKKFELLQWIFWAVLQNLENLPLVLRSTLIPISSPFYWYDILALKQISHINDMLSHIMEMDLTQPDCHWSDQILNQLSKISWSDKNNSKRHHIYKEYVWHS